MSIASRVLAGLVLLLIVAGSSFWAGDHQRNNAWLVKQAKADREAHDKYEAEVDRSNKAAGHFLTELGNQEDRYAELENKFEALRKRIPLLVPPAVAPATQTAGAGSEPYIAPAPGPGMAVQSELSLGAVWMWNSALAGADVPAGACGADAAAEEGGAACSQGAGITLDDAWDNHTVNARSCAADRLRHQRLIDYLKGRTQ